MNEIFHYSILCIQGSDRCRNTLPRLPDCRLHRHPFAVPPPAASRMPRRQTLQRTESDNVEMNGNQSRAHHSHVFYLEFS